jgi:hypothetical protein
VPGLPGDDRVEEPAGRVPRLERRSAWQRDLSISRNKLGDVAVAAGDLAGAGEHYRAAQVIAERLAAADPTNTGWQRDLSISRNKLGDDEALTLDREALAIYLRRQPERFAADVENAKRNVLVDLVNSGRTDDEAVHELDQFTRSVPDEFPE